MVPKAKNHFQDRQPQSLGWIINNMERGPQDINTCSGPYLGSVAVAVGISEPRHPLMFNTECVVWPSARRLACLRQARAVGQ